MSLRPCSFGFSPFSLCCSGWVISVVLSSSSVIPLSFLLLSPCTEIFISGIMFFGSGTPMWSLTFAVTLCFFADCLLFLPCFRCVCGCSWKRSVMASWVSFGSSAPSVVPALVSVSHLFSFLLRCSWFLLWWEIFCYWMLDILGVILRDSRSYLRLMF